jgi:hypothetical protein
MSQENVERSYKMNCLKNITVLGNDFVNIENDFSCTSMNLNSTWLSYLIAV